MNKEYKYGFNLQEDIEQLYGENYEELNNKRINLCNSLDSSIHSIKRLRNIIQNPVPITKQQFTEWIEIRNNTLNEYKYDITFRIIQALKDIAEFAYRYHIVE